MQNGQMLKACHAMQQTSSPGLWHDLCQALAFGIREMPVLLQAFYVPFAFMGISLISGGNWVSDLLGIIVGHL